MIMSLSSGSVWRGLSTVFKKGNQISNQLIPANNIRCARISTNSTSPTSGSTSRTKGPPKASNDMWTDASGDGIGGYFLPSGKSDFRKLDPSSVFLPRHGMEEILSNGAKVARRVITSPREVAAEAAKKASDIPGNLFTDGSRLLSGYCGSSVAWKTQDHVWHNQRIHLGDAKEVLDAELYAIAEALQTAREQQISTNGTKEVQIYSDSLEALRRIQDNVRDPWQCLVRMIAEREKPLLRGGYSVEYHWVPGHEGIRGNEEADKAAKKAAIIPVMEGVKPIPREDLFMTRAPTERQKRKSLKKPPGGSNPTNHGSRE
jgi:ribonuclease HI